MFKKMKDGKGFTLIEMLVVIAVVAILVSVVVPVVTGSTDKAAAATNASNLRSVEGEIVSMMLLEPSAFYKLGIDQSVQQGVVEDVYNKANEELEEDVQDVEYLKSEAERIEDDIIKLEGEIATIKEQGTAHSGCSTTSVFTCSQGCSKQSECSWKQFIGKKGHDGETVDTVNCALGSDNCASIRAAYDDVGRNELKLLNLKAEKATADTAYSTAKSALEGLQGVNEQIKDASLAAIFNFQADENGEITLDNGTVIQAPPSKEVNKDGVTIEADVRMTIYVDTTTYEAYAYYGNYRAADFAAAAE